MGQTSEDMVTQTFNFPRTGDQPLLFKAKINDGAPRLEDFRISQVTLISLFLNNIPTKKNLFILVSRPLHMRKALIRGLPGPQQSAMERRENDVEHQS